MGKSVRLTEKGVVVSVTISVGDQVVTTEARLPSLSSAKRFWQDLHRGALPLPYGPCLSTDLYRAYQCYCRRMGETLPGNINAFSREFMLMDGVRRVVKRVPSGRAEGGKSSGTQRTIFAMGKPGRGLSEDNWVTKGIEKFLEQLRSYLDEER